ncbi:hypothetical protein SUDANB96_06805 (plasmid) [Streptomyces sp. enrichment culture]
MFWCLRRLVPGRSRGTWPPVTSGCWPGCLSCTASSGPCLTATGSATSLPVLLLISVASGAVAPFLGATPSDPPRGAPGDGPVGACTTTASPTTAGAGRSRLPRHPAGPQHRAPAGEQCAAAHCSPCPLPRRSPGVLARKVWKVPVWRLRTVRRPPPHTARTPKTEPRVRLSVRQFMGAVGWFSDRNSALIASLFHGFLIQGHDGFSGGCSGGFGFRFWWGVRATVPTVLTVRYPVLWCVFGLAGTGWRGASMLVSGRSAAWWRVLFGGSRSPIWLRWYFLCGPLWRVGFR